MRQVSGYWALLAVLWALAPMLGGASRARAQDESGQVEALPDARAEMARIDARLGELRSELKLRSYVGPTTMIVAGGMMTGASLLATFLYWVGSWDSDREDEYYQLPAERRNTWIIMGST